MASGHVNRIKRPDTWLHRPMLQNVKKVLANPEPSTHGTLRRAVAAWPKENYESHPGVRFNTLNKPAKPSGRGQGLRSTGSLARSTFLLFFGSLCLMRRSGDAAAGFLALGSCQCRLAIFGVAVGLRGCGGVS